MFFTIRYSEVNRRAGLAGLCMTMLLLGPRLVEASPSTFLLGGIQVNEPDHAHWIQSLKQAGMNTVSVTVYAKQGDWDSSNLWYEPEEPAVVHEIRIAKKAGMNVVLILRVALDHAFERNRFYWHGMIMPRTDADVKEWFFRYGRFVEKWGAIATQEQVDVLGIASEMSSMTSTAKLRKIPELESYLLDESQQIRENKELLRYKERIRRVLLRAEGAREDETLETFLNRRSAAKTAWAKQLTYYGSQKRIEKINLRRAKIEAQWLRVIHQARKVYPGVLTYAANFDQYEFVTFWPKLDQIAINAYFRLRYDLRSKPKGLFDQLSNGWKTVLGRLERFRKSVGMTGRSVLFTELGYTHRRYSTVSPWMSGGFSMEGPVENRQLIIWSDQPDDIQERAASLRALRIANDRITPDLLGGILYWKLTTQPEHRMIEPFVVILADPPVDPIQDQLRKFLKDHRPAYEAKTP